MTDNIIQLPLKGSEGAAAQPANPLPAEESLLHKRGLLKQASREDCHDWLIFLSCGVNGVTESQIKTREEAVWSMCHDLPAFVWCPATVHLMWKRTSFLPTPGECHDVLAAYAAPVFAEIAELERILNAAPARVDGGWTRASRDWSDPLKIQAAVKALDGVPMRLVLGRVLAAAVARHAHHLIELVPVEFRGQAPETVQRLGQDAGLR